MVCLTQLAWPHRVGLAPAALGVGRDVSGRARAEAGDEGTPARGDHAAGTVHRLARGGAAAGSAMRGKHFRVDQSMRLALWNPIQGDFFHEK